MSVVLRVLSIAGTAALFSLTLSIGDSRAADPVTASPPVTTSSNADQASKEVHDMGREPRDMTKEIAKGAADVEGGCRRIGERVISLLYRDDVDQSHRFLDFYRLFNCRENRLAPSFSCLTLKADAEAARYQAVLSAVNGDASKVKKEEQQVELGRLVSECWSNPAG